MRINHDDLRNLCIRNNWCTHMNNDQYYHLIYEQTGEHLTEGDYSDAGMTLLEIRRELDTIIRYEAGDHR